jgi:arylsulfatase
MIYRLKYFITKTPSVMKNSLWLFLVSLMISSCSGNSPNIVLVLTDDQGYGDLSIHGSPDVSTPNIDKLSMQSIRLTDFQASPTCSPTRSAIMTGRHPFKNGITHTVLERERLALEATTLPQILKRAGYANGIFGKWHLGDEAEHQPDKRGFDEVFIHGAGGIGQAFPGTCADVPGNKYFDPVIKHNGTFVQTRGFCTDVFFIQALSWIRKRAETNKPFFAYITLNAPHGPFVAPESYKTKFAEKGYPGHAQGFYGMIENIDDNVGILMDKLDSWGLADNTILIFMSDNGKTWVGGNNTVHGETYNTGMRGFKGSVFEGGTRVPFFIRWPERFAEGREVDVMLNHFDILPTLADITGIDISDLQDIDGQSFLPLLESKPYRKTNPYRFFHTGRWPMDSSIVRTVEKHKSWFSSGEGSDPETYKYQNCAVRNERFRFVNDAELYDLLSDPGETTNVADKYPEVMAGMRRAYNEWWDSVQPLLVNENESLNKEKPFWVDYENQKSGQGIPEWESPTQ